MKEIAKEDLKPIPMQKNLLMIGKLLGEYIYIETDNVKIAEMAQEIMKEHFEEHPL